MFPVVTKCRSLFSGCDDGKHNGISTYPPLTRRASTFPHWCEGHTGARYSIYTNWANSWQLNHVMFIISFHSVCRFLASYCHGYYYRIGRRKGKKKLIDQTDTSLERKVGARTDPSHKFHLTKINRRSSSSSLNKKIVELFRSNFCFWFFLFLGVTGSQLADNLIEMARWEPKTPVERWKEFSSLSLLGEPCNDADPLLH